MSRARAALLALFVALLVGCRAPDPAPSATPPPPTLTAPPPTATARPIPALDWAAEMARSPRCDPDEQRAAMRDGEPLPALARCADVTLALDGEAARFRAVARLRLTNGSDEAWPTLLLRLYPRAETPYNGEITLNEARLDGAPIAVAERFADRTGLFVRLPAPLPPGESVELALDYEGALERPPLARGSYGLFARTERAAVLTSWLPTLAPWGGGGWVGAAVPRVGDAVAAESGWLRATIHAPAALALAASGVTLSESTGDDFTIHEIVTGPTRDVALIFLDGYEALIIEAGGVTLRSWHPPVLREGAVAALVAAERSLALFERRFGPYPFRELDIVPLPLQSYAGMEFPQLLLIGEWLYAGRTLERSDDLQQLVAHEVAHQWWYGVVGSDPTREAWLDEGLATWSELLWMEASQGSAAVEARREAARRWIEANEIAPGAFRRPSARFDGRDEYNALVYHQSDLFLEALREEMGERAFSDALICYYEAQRFRLARARDLLSCMDELAPSSLEALYEQWEIAR